MKSTPVQASPSIYDVFRLGRADGATPIDLTIGNPHLKPPASYYEALEASVRELREMPGNGHGYMTASDPFGLCRNIAADLAERFGAPFAATDILATVGATGAIDVILKTIIRPTVDVCRPQAPASAPDEIIVVAPYFVEYLNLVRGNGAVPVVVESTSDFQLDVARISDAIGPRTRAILVNSPNNPTGRIYSEDSLKELAAALESKNREFGIRVLVIEDAVYDALVFSGRAVPSLIPHYSSLIRVNSYSKSLSLSGERLGHLAVHPDFAPDARRAEFVANLNLNMRMRVVHAPLLQHRVVARMPLRGLVDIDAYRRNVDRLHLTLSSLGFGVGRPEATFYLWAVLPDIFRTEEEFRELAFQGPSPLHYLPGSLFGGDAYRRCVRFSACVPFPEIERACARLREIASARREMSGAEQ